MNAVRWGVAAVLACMPGALSGAAAASDETAKAAPAEFAPPVRIRAGDKWLGEKRLFPSPVLHDLDGDGVPEVVVADLPGRPTFARMVRGEGGAVTLSAESPLLGSDGKPLSFSNW